MLNLRTPVIFSTIPSSLLGFGHVVWAEDTPLFSLTTDANGTYVFAPAVNALATQSTTSPAVVMLSAGLQLVPQQKIVHSVSRFCEEGGGHTDYGADTADNVPLISSEAIATTIRLAETDTLAELWAVFKPRILPAIKEAGNCNGTATSLAKFVQEITSNPEQSGKVWVEVLRSGAYASEWNVNYLSEDRRDETELQEKIHNGNMAKWIKELSGRWEERWLALAVGRYLGTDGEFKDPNRLKFATTVAAEILAAASGDKTTE